MAKKLTPQEEQAYADLAAALRRLRQAQELIRQQKRRKVRTPHKTPDKEVTSCK